jgi:ubiquinone/menaquinone biosynthesis C-methylase UbiE
MTRAECEQTIAPIIQGCLQFSEFRQEKSSVALANLKPDIRRVSLIFSLADGLLGDSAGGNGLEVGSGYGYLLFSLAALMPGVRWTAVDHPERDYVQSEAYLRAFSGHNCSLVTRDITRQPLPFPDGHFSLVTFSEVLEHLPVERVSFVLSELARVVQPGGVLIASSPNQASLENRLRLLRGRSILDMPDEMGYAKGTFGHIRLYTVAEIKAAMAERGFTLARTVLESNNSAYRGTSNGGWRRRAHRLYERLEGMIPALRSMGDSWYMAFRKGADHTRAS